MTITDNRGRVLLFKSRGVVSSLIRWHTRSEYSHAALLYPDGQTIIESMQGQGVRKRTLTTADWKTIVAFDVMPLTASAWLNVLAAAEVELGSGYDYRAVLRFVTRMDAPHNDKWFCSELVFACIAKAGLNLLKADAWQVDPGHLAWSPFLVQDTP